MWKKDEDDSVARGSDQRRPKATTGGSGRTGSRATIGPSITIRGDVTGSEDLLIQGSVDGSVLLEEHALAVGSEGRVSANIRARVITIEGEVEGDLTAQDQIALLGSARVQGDIKAPRVVLEDGASFRGQVDMGASTRAQAAEKAEAKPSMPDEKSASGGTNGSDRAKSPTAPKAKVKSDPGTSGSKQEPNVATKGAAR